MTLPNSVQAALNSLVAALEEAFATPEPAPVPTPTPEPEPTPEPTPVPTPVPTTVLYGPTGKHDFGLPAASAVHEVEPTWAAIKTQATSCQSHAGRCDIAVKPGTLPSGTSASSSTAGVLSSVGSTGKIVVIRPRDGFGTVKVGAGKGTAFVGLKGIYFDRIDFSATDAVMVRNSDTFGFAKTRVQQLLGTANNSTPLRNGKFVEVVAGPEMVTGVGYDRAQFKTASGGTIDGLQFIGCYIAPNWKPKGDSGHCDSVQFEQLSGGGGAITNVTFEDTALFRSSDQGVQTNALRGGLLKKSAFFGWDATKHRYPLYPGGDPATLDNVLNGAWTDIVAEDTVVSGSISNTYSFKSVVRSKSTQATRGFATLGSISSSELDRIAPVPTDSLWR